MLTQETSLLLVRALYLVAIGGAGLVGLLTLAAPRLGSRYLFFGEVEVGPYLRILGALWLTLGTVAVLGLGDPLKFSPLLLIQAIYKSVWVLFVAAPALAAGRRSPGLVFFTGLFGVWAAVLLLAMPYGHLFG